MTEETKLIKGAGGGPPPPPPATYRAPDTFHSRSFATVQDLISEGEKQQRRLELIGDQTNPFIYWEPTDEYKDLGHEKCSKMI